MTYHRGNGTHLKNAHVMWATIMLARRVLQKQHQSLGAGARQKRKPYAPVKRHSIKKKVQIEN
ncbi:hypothetical protein LC087_04675 [Bacillus carboniphilus]|uniref:Uncharacterized protein n=1 Tax=Bacillus carboniphilus TaxID=86663 RepID=A0ABY9JYE8_9BACI|nr:hypothetical protein [Bacillus carboniphilus]WLR43470.1 hypothetical protein LC087_04675 [Bacillus carboniphilus]